MSASGSFRNSSRNARRGGNVSHHANPPGDIATIEHRPDQTAEPRLTGRYGLFVAC